jgi:hypothetical protein
MSLDADQLYTLLPAVYRTRDAAAGGQLRALFGALAAQSDVVSQNLRQLYDDLFIETCEPWVIPYIGDLIGYNSAYELAAVSDSRTEVANTIGYRRRKGTKIALQQAAIDVSDRPAVVIEEFQQLIITQSMRHARPGHETTVSMRDEAMLRLLGHASSNGLTDSPFDPSNRTIDVRRIAPRVRDAACAHAATGGTPTGGTAPPASAAPPDATPLDIALHGPGRANIQDVAIHLWRWQAFQVQGAPAFAVGGGQFAFSPLGIDMPLFTPAKLPQSFTALLTRDNVPAPIARAELTSYYTPENIWLVADGVPVSPGQVCRANLADRPDGSRCVPPPGKIAIDPELGRIRFAADLSVPQSLEVSYWYGFPARIGGGPYNRTTVLKDVLPPSPGFTAVVGSPEFPALETAVAGWNAFASGSAAPAGVIVVQGYGSLTVDVTGPAAIQLPPEANLAIVAGQPDLTWKDSLVTLTGDIEVTGLTGTPAQPNGASQPGTGPLAGQLLINGIWLAGRLLVSGAPCTVNVSDSTLVPGHELLSDGTPLHPGEPSILVTAIGATLVLNRVISGPVAAGESGSTRIAGSVIDATSPYYVAYAGPDLASAGPDLCVEGSTLIGKVRARTITLASNSIFHARLGNRDPWQAAVWASRQQSGCVRFCSLPAGSITPRQYECLPPDAASTAALAPQFITVHYGSPAYGLLSGDCPMAVWAGADNGSQLGVYWQMQETEAVRNVQIRAPEYLPARLEAGVFLHPSRAMREERHEPSLYGYGYQRGYGFTGIGAELV